MIYIATKEALEKLNEYRVTELEILQENKAREHYFKTGKVDKLVLDWKGKELIVTQIRKNKLIIFKYGQEINENQENIIKIKYKNNQWEMARKI